MKAKKVLGIGNALVDKMIRLDQEDLLQQLELPKGSMQLVDDSRSKRVSEVTAHLSSIQSSGGSAANTIHGLARLGVDTAFIGHVGEDITGKFFKDDMLAAGIKPLLFSSNTPSGVAQAFVTNDGERTFATYLGAAIELSANHLNENLFSGYDYFYIEGYLVQNKELLIKAIDLASKSGSKVAIDLASYNVVEDQKDFLLDLLRSNKINLVFANEEEARALTGLAPREALDFIANHCEIAIVKVGREGSLIKHLDQVYPVEPIKANAIDTTGAGDMYASGFLYGLSNQLSLEKAGKIGSLLAGNVIEVIGAKMSQEQWDSIRKQIREIEAGK
jgi:sugar/nucleoside kinase (ribokinase family)